MRVSMNASPRRGGFTLIELLVVVGIVLIASLFLVACYSGPNVQQNGDGQQAANDNLTTEQQQRRKERAEALSGVEEATSFSFVGRRRMTQNITQLRGIHQGMNIYAQSNKVGTSEGRFPGLDEKGQILSAKDAPDFAPDGADGADPAVRYAIMLDRNLFSGDYAISPGDVGVDGKTPWTAGDQLSEENYSYAMLRLTGNDKAAEARRAEWVETLNSEAIVMSDRNNARTDGGTSSIWTRQSTSDEQKRWRGCVVFNDNHAVMHESASFDGRYDNTRVTDDSLFATDEVAEMVYSDSHSLSQQY